MRTPPYAPVALAGGNIIVTNGPSLGCTRELIVPDLDGNVVHRVQVVAPMTPKSTKSFSPPLGWDRNGDEITVPLNHFGDPRGETIVIATSCHSSGLQASRI